MLPVAGAFCGEFDAKRQTATGTRRGFLGSEDFLRSADRGGCSLVCGCSEGETLVLFRPGIVAHRRANPPPPPRSRDMMTTTPRAGGRLKNETLAVERCRAGGDTARHILWLGHRPLATESPAATARREPTPNRRRLFTPRLLTSTSTIINHGRRQASHSNPHTEVHQKRAARQKAVRKLERRVTRSSKQFFTRRIVCSN